ncbi:hypothetical protein [Photobacterium profundum]|uniref:PIN-like domain-containing protein n=1 Tax=Photobacterium profundum (strain SS9) TaxID=298386 RepID=Q6LHR5_PHOPR|nr:hypothetical protein [Photobacterium profundum]CAG23165.1 hypothetical protein PBPRB1294 [Photobacterium profundum SS9]
MKMIFVDAENVGLKELEKVEASIVDKVFVFSRVESIKQVCEKLLYLCLSDYPEGANQADFYIIAYLARVLTSLPRRQFCSVSFSLFSNDENLISAFKFQCAQLGAQCDVVRTKTNTVVVLKASTPAEKLYANLKQPKELAPLQKQLGLSKPDFTKAINELMAGSKIKRSAESKKMWVQC